MAITEEQLQEYLNKGCSLVEGTFQPGETFTSEPIPGEIKSILVWPEPQQPYQGMNKTEAFYESKILAPGKFAGEIMDYRFEPFKLILVHGIPHKVNEKSYKPDFLVVTPEVFRVVEVKACKESMKEDGWVALKMACEMFPWFQFVLALVNPKTGVIEEEILT